MEIMAATTCTPGGQGETHDVEVGEVHLPGSESHVTGVLTQWGDRTWFDRKTWSFTPTIRR